ncbi:hypothetical protein ACFL6Y_04940 [Elusimicrobiota bacterium]
MSPDISKQSPSIDDPSTYRLLKSGDIKIVASEKNPPVPIKSTPTLGSPWLSASLILVMLALFFDSSYWFNRTVLAIEAKQQEAAHEPFKLWAQKHPLTYEEVNESPMSYISKPVIWTIMHSESEHSYHNANATNLVFWSNVNQLESRISITQSKKKFKMLGLIEGEKGSFPKLKFLEVY